GGDPLLGGYFGARLEELLRDTVLTALTAVQAQMRALSQLVSRARQRLSDLSAAFPLESASVSEEWREKTATELATRHWHAHSPAAFAELYPFGCGDLAAAREALLSGRGAEVLGPLDLLFQEEVLDQGGGLWALLTGETDQPQLTLSQSLQSAAFWDLIGKDERVAEEVREGLLSRARRLVEGALEGEHLLGLLEQRHG